MANKPHLAQSMRHPQKGPAMTAISILAMIVGAALLIFLPMPRDQLARVASQGLGALLFAVGLVGLVFTLFAQAAPHA